jgi:two-component system, NarL family, nitrate/nitrite response regulator NarL
MPKRASQKPRVRVVVAEDHPMFREGLARAIKERPDLQLVGEAENGREALRVVEAESPDVCVFDVKMPEIEGIEVLKTLRSRGIDVAVLFLSAFINHGVVYQAFEAGAKGFLPKQTGRSEICDSIVKVSEGRPVVPDEVQAVLNEGIRAAATQRQFSDRELEVLRLVVAGKSNTEIAGVLGITPEGVKSHLYEGLFPKLGVKSRAEASAEATRRGLLD